eukprot:CAMPEP_0115694306 /NCGR_PEP_ID=MMETSP0272-20121206/64177_1 /TAXON_ID=71861 /ORGANISM="Scrippsiella trochoidea, Strain CCMP3099" /LENGTH=83 /DNA_ID=CAMNT_0003134459 /DNA_START=585 /DNA_END=836 /DNA_ORIENTATION=+
MKLTGVASGSLAPRIGSWSTTLLRHVPAVGFMLRVALIAARTFLPALVSFAAAGSSTALEAAATPVSAVVSAARHTITSLAAE